MAGTNTPNSPVFFEGGEQIKKTEKQLNSYAEKTTNMSVGIGPFNNFLFERGRGDDLRRWHPVKYHCNDSQYADTC